MNPRDLVVRAPGKLVLWGEYAVLTGAPAGVMAVNRYAQCRFASARTWALTTSGFNAPSGVTARPLVIRDHWLRGKPPPVGHAGRLFWFAAREAGLTLGSAAQQIHMDTSDLYRGQEKFGLGSSAALGTALYVGCCELQGTRPQLAAAINLHRASQDNAGSGIDVAASFHGGLLRFQLDAQATPVSWPQNLHWRAFWSGRSASTPAHLARFDAWRRKGDTQVLADLTAACQQCAQALSLSTLADYIQCLREFDRISAIGIYAEGHANLHKLADSSRVVYKPCGAGGGDLGIALSHDPTDLDDFADRAQAQGFVETHLELAQHGVEANRGHHQPHP